MLSRAIGVLSGALVIMISSILQLPAQGLPMNLLNFSCILCAALLGGLSGTGSVGIFIMAGCLGLKVFFGHGSGFAFFTSDLGGFVIGLFASSVATGLVAGFPYADNNGKTVSSAIRIIVGILLGFAVFYIPGIIMYRRFMDDAGSPISLAQSLEVLVKPNLPLDLTTAALVSILTFLLRPAVQKHLYPDSREDEMMERIGNSRPGR